jgi:hypothetical protein
VSFSHIFGAYSKLRGLEINPIKRLGELPHLRVGTFIVGLAPDLAHDVQHLSAVIFALFVKAAKSCFSQELPM